MMAVTMWSSVVLVISCALVVPGYGASIPIEPVFAAAAERTNNDQEPHAIAFNDVSSIFVRNKRQQAQCQQVGEYCRYHDECCSKLCLSFSYKCVGRAPQSPFTPVITQGPVGGGGSTTVIQGTGGGGGEDIVNRLGESSNNANNSEPKTCAPVGGYCQRSNDCCSQSCLSFSYKCIRNNNIPVFRPPSPNQQGGIFTQSNIFEVGQPIPRPEDAITIDELVNRFGEGGEQLSSNSVAPLPVTNAPPPLGGPSNSASPVFVPPTTLVVPQQQINTSGPGNKFQCVATGGQCQFSNQCCTRLCAQTSPDNRFCAVQVMDLTPPGQQSHGSSLQVNSENCQPIGGKCYAHADCCSTRCHIYLQKCVT